MFKIDEDIDACIERMIDEKAKKCDIIDTLKRWIIRTAKCSNDGVLMQEALDILTRCEIGFDNSTTMYRLAKLKEASVKLRKAASNE